MLEYISIILSFLAAAIAVFGDTWDSKRKGFKKLRPLGLAALIIGTLTLCFSIYNTHSSKSKLEELRKSDLAFLKSSVTQLIEPFKKLMSSTKFTINGNRIEWASVDSLLYYASTAGFKREVSQIKLTQKIGYDDTLSWYEYLQANNAKSSLELTAFLKEHSNGIDANSKILVNDILNDPLFSKVIPIFKVKSSLKPFEFKASTIADIFQFQSKNGRYNQ